MLSIAYLRHFRFGPFTYFDTLGSLIGVYFLAPHLSKLFRKINLEIPEHSWIYLTLPIAVLTHFAIGKNTPLTEMFMDPTGHPIAKVSILILFLLGMKDIRPIKRRKKS